jgi:hypothetical protein
MIDRGPGSAAGTVGCAMTQPRSGRRARTIVIVVGILALLCCGVFIAGGFGFTSLLNTSGPAREAADTFLKQIQSGDASGAYASLCVPTRNRFTESAFAATVHNRPLTSYSINGTSVANVNGNTTGRVSVELHYADGTSEKRAVPLVTENDQWRVCGQPY